MPAPEAPRRKPQAPEPSPEPGAEAAPAPPRFSHQRIEEAEPGERPRFGHGSGCIPIILISLSILGLLAWLGFIGLGLGLSWRMTQHASSRPPVSSRPVSGQAPSGG